MANTKAFERTDRAITNALISLLKVKSFEKITVQDILDETPVNRATFYAHFHDKYEIAERMLSEFKAVEKNIVDKLSIQKKSNYPQIMQTAFLQKRDLVEALLKIHTDKVDLRMAIASGWREKYLAESDSPNKETEAEMYAQAMTAFQLSFITDGSFSHFSSTYVDQLMIEILLHVTQIDAEETRAFLYEQVKKRDSLHDSKL
ncbi:MAG: TetR family transcriptional regulator [Agathobacter sp.]|nr:TetR family transcriptional regulator [Agathobacter sp.]